MSGDAVAAKANVIESVFASSNDAEFIASNCIIYPPRKSLDIFPIPGADYSISLNIEHSSPREEMVSNVEIIDNKPIVTIRRPLASGVKTAHWDIGVAQNETHFYYMNFCIDIVGEGLGQIAVINYNTFRRGKP